MAPPIFTQAQVPLLPFSWFFSRYLYSANARFSVFRNFIFTNGLPNLKWYIFGDIFFVFAYFFEYFNLPIFAEFKYLEKIQLYGTVCTFEEGEIVG